MDLRVRSIAVFLIAVAGFFAACSDEPDLTSPQPDVDHAVAIDGTFTARVTKKDLAPFEYVPKSWPGEWTLTVSGSDYVLEYPNFRVTEDIMATEGEINITASPAPAGAFNCFTEEGERLTGEGEASGVYSYVLTEEEFELTAEEELCDLRRALLERTWKVSS